MSLSTVHPGLRTHQRPSDPVFGVSRTAPVRVRQLPPPPGPLSAPLARRALELSLELGRVSLERDSLSRELLRTIRQKVALTQELEAWQDDMQVVIGQQLRSQRQKELSAAGAAPRRAATRFSLLLGPGPAGGFLSNLFRRT